MTFISGVAGSSDHVSLHELDFCSAIFGAVVDPVYFLLDFGVGFS